MVRSSREKPATAASASVVIPPPPRDALGEGDRQFVTALARGLEILNCFRDARLDISGSELAAMTGLPQPTVWRLCHTMIELGFLIPSSGDRMRPGLPLLRLGQVALAGMPLLAKSYDGIQSLARKCRGAVDLAAWDGSRMVLVQQGRSEGQSLMNLKVGSRIELATSGLGWGLLAGFEEDERAALLEEFAASDPQWPNVTAAFLTEMGHYKKRGYVLGLGSWHPDFNTIALPIMGLGGKPAFALSCTVTALTNDATLLQRDIAPKLLKLAALLEKEHHSQQREQKGRPRQGRRL